MPVEGQAKRLREPLSRRDRRFLWLLVAVAALAAAAAAVLYAVRTGSGSSARCVAVTLPSTMGGAELRTCGAKAHTFCRTQAPREPRIAEACRKQGFAADLVSASP